MMSSASVMNPLPTKDPRQEEHTKQSLCQCRPSKEMNLVPPMPKINSCQQEKTVRKKSACKLSVILTGDGFGTSCTTFRKEFSKTLCAIRFVISGSKALTSQGFGAMSASEAFAMPGIVAVGYSTLSNNL